MKQSRGNAAYHHLCFYFCKFLADFSGLHLLLVLSSAVLALPRSLLISMLLCVLHSRLPVGGAFYLVNSMEHFRRRRQRDERRYQRYLKEVLA